MKAKPTPTWPFVLIAVVVLVAVSRAAAARGGAGILRFEEGMRRETLPESFKGKDTRRDVADVDTVVIHVTDVAGGFGVSPQQVAAAGGDKGRARRARYEHTPYHAVYSPRDRASILQWPVWAYSWHGDGANRTSIGWSYDGAFPGDRLDVEGARASLRHAVEAYRAAGAPLRFVEAHMQHSAERSDPGVEIWTQVVRPLLRELGLEERPEHVTRDGKPLPAAWLR